MFILIMFHFFEVKIYIHFKIVFSFYFQKKKVYTRGVDAIFFVLFFFQIYSTKPVVLLHIKSYTMIVFGILLNLSIEKKKKYERHKIIFTRNSQSK